MNGAFADTSFYVALLHKHDKMYRQAHELASSLRWRVFTTEYVLVELGNWLAATSQRAAFAPTLNDLYRDRNTLIIDASASLFKEGVDLYSRRLDKQWSLTDCISFVVMQNEGLREALTTDHHFEQAGFAILLK